MACPYCGFRAVTPDLTCIVCGRSVKEEDLKQSIGFTGLLEVFAATSPRHVVLEVYRSGYVVYDGELHPPSVRSRTPLGVVLYLTRKEKEILARALQREES